MSSPDAGANPYRIAAAADGRPPEVRRAADGAPVLPDVGLQDYCDYLTWAAAPGAAAAAPPGVAATANPDLADQGAEFFADADRLIARCKAAGVLLHAGWAGDDAGRPAGTAGANLLGGGEPRLTTAGARPPAGGPPVEFHRLYEAVALTPRHGQPVVDGLRPQRTPFLVGPALLAALNARLADPEDDVRRLSSLPVDRAFVYVDISEFSKYPPGQQAVVINALIRVVASPTFWNDPGGLAHAARQDQEAALCIGDGYIFVHRRSWHAVVFAAYLAYRIEFLLAKNRIPEFHFRVGVHVGPVYRFWDVGRRDWNYIGDGIIVGQRVLGAIGRDQDDVVFLSAETRRDLQAHSDHAHTFTSIVRWVQNRGRRTDKHGQPRRLYELNHTGYIRSVIDPTWLDATD